MTVEQLIEALEQMPPSAQVFCDGERDDYINAVVWHEQYNEVELS